MTRKTIILYIHIHTLQLLSNDFSWKIKLKKRCLKISFGHLSVDQHFKFCFVLSKTKWWWRWWLNNLFSLFSFDYFFTKKKTNDRLLFDEILFVQISFDVLIYFWIALFKSSRSCWVFYNFLFSSLLFMAIGSSSTP